MLSHLVVSFVLRKDDIFFHMTRVMDKKKIFYNTFLFFIRKLYIYYRFFFCLVRKRLWEQKLLSQWPFGTILYCDINDAIYTLTVRTEKKNVIVISFNNKCSVLVKLLFFFLYNRQFLASPQKYVVLTPVSYCCTEICLNFLQESLVRPTKWKEIVGNI